ncbi:hypothetical protein WJX73_008668 [Symbiochloris irregularis]|uniref:Long-chain-fatty-acid--CoA ligase n=1 Tax=Symbiochloris irregularis TaxID=706552 RepID=A0AAW1P2F2_9CHLO
MAERDRLTILRGHIEQIGTSPDSTLHLQNTSATQRQNDSVVAVTLPERLSDSTGWTVRRSTLSPQRLISTFESPDEGIRTMHDNWDAAIAKYSQSPCLGTRAVDSTGKAGAYQWLTYEQAGEARTAIGSGLVKLGVSAGQAVGLYSVNCRDWVLVDAACHAYSLVPVPLYDTLGAESVEYIMKHAELAAIACSVAAYPTLLQALGACPGVKLVVVYGTQPGQPQPAAPSGLACKVLSLEAVAALGRANPTPHNPPQPYDIATLCYTSGTTGVPKGAILSHDNLISNAAACQNLIPAQHDDTHISYLPLAHIYERVMQIGLIHAGAQIGFYRGDVLELLDDMLELRPTIFFSVPRLYSRVYDRVMTAIREGNPIARRLFETGFAQKKAAIARGDLTGGRMAPLWDRLVFSKIAARLGGRVRVMVSGASPLPPDVMDFLRVCFPGATVLEGYGMTESACTICVSGPDDWVAGHVGPPLPCNEVKLADVPEMNYTNADQPYPRGEICVRGPNIFRGYFKDEEQTREMIDADGWLHSGDIGTWLPGNRLRIIDRKKNIFKLAQGEYLAPEKVEGVYSRSPLVAQSFVYGDSFRSQLVAVVVPDPDNLIPWAAARKLPKDLKQLCQDKTVVDAVLRSMLEQGRTAKLKGFEQVAAIHLFPDPFSVENGLLTPTFKLKRPQAKQEFQQAIEAMYKTLGK